VKECVLKYNGDKIISVECDGEKIMIGDTVGIYSVRHGIKFPTTGIIRDIDLWYKGDKNGGFIINVEYDSKRIPRVWKVDCIETKLHNIYLNGNKYKVDLI